MKVDIQEIKNKLISHIQKFNKESTFYFLLGVSFAGLMVSSTNLS
jgi:hypothetical protein